MSDPEVAVENRGFVSLHNHTTFSILDSLIKPADLFQRAKELGQEAIAVTDHGTLAGIWDSLQASKKTGVKLIAGCEFYFVDDVAEEESRMRHVILLAKNAKGYENLLKTAAEGYDNFTVLFKRVFSRIDWKILEKYHEGLICITACSNGILGQLINQKKLDEARENAQRLKAIFGDDLGIELQAHALKRTNNAYSGEIDQQYTNDRLREIANELGIKCIVTTDAHYVYPEQHKAHDVLLAISAGHPVDSGSRLKYCGTNGVLSDFHVKTGEEVYKKLNRQFGRKDADFAQLCIDNAKEFADRCEFPDWIDPKYSNPSGKELPEFPVKDQPDYEEFLAWAKSCPKEFIEGKEEDSQYIRYRCEKVFNDKYSKLENSDVYRKRLEKELDVFQYCGVSSYILMVADIIEWCSKNGVSTGPGRGSAAGSLVSYFLGIHEADPIKYGLVFERFYNKHKKDYGDVDLDISTKNRHKVVDYIIKKYGKDNVAAISNYNTLTPKVYARAIARSFLYGGDRKSAVQIGTAIADSIPGDIKIVKKAIETAPLFSQYAESIANDGAGYTELKEYANDIGGQIVAVSTHAAGYIINKRPLRGLIPLRRDKDGNISVEADKDRAEAQNLVKMDLLGLSTLDIIDDTIDLIKESGEEIKEFNYHTYDKDTYDLISRGDTFGVFQFGTSGGTIDLCKKYQPKSIEDLAMITTLARPAATDIRVDFFKVKNGEKEISLLHPLMKSAFENTLGFALYDESLLVLVEDLAKWDLAKGDILRKITKGKGKYPEKEKKAKDDFINDAVNNSGLSKHLATEIYEKVIEPFTTYSFNKSHAITYSMVSYKTAWLKAHYPLEFLVANLKSEVNSNARIAKDNIARIKEEIRRLNVKILPPDINKSDTAYRIVDNKTLLTGFDALKYMGKDAIPEILAKRPFTSFEDFLTKIDGRKVRAPAIQALAASGCLDSFGMSRKLMFLYAADYKKKLGEFLKKKKKDADTFKEFNYPWPDEGEWTISEKCALERYYLGEGLSGDKVQEYNGFFTHGATHYSILPKLHPAPPDTMSTSEQRKYTKRVTLLQGEVKNFFEFKVKKEDSKIRGEVMAKVTLEDPHGNQMTMTCFPDGWLKLQNRCLELSNNKHKFDVGVGLYINGSLNWYEGDISLIFEDLAKFSPPPQLPKDLEAKKVKLVQPRAKSAKNKKGEELERTILLDELEEELIELGHADLDDDDGEIIEFK